MGNRIFNQEAGRYPKKKQDAETYNKGGIGEIGEIGQRASNLVRLIGAERVSRREFQYEGTFYVTEDGETYNKEYIDAHKALRTKINFYEVSNWIYNKRKQLYEPIIRRIVMIKSNKNQLSLNL